MKVITTLAIATCLAAASARAGEIACSGSITSIQGEGIVAREHRFEVDGVTGSDVMAVLEKCKKIAQERQNRAAKLNPGGTFRSTSRVELRCSEEGRTFEVRRLLRTR